VHTTHDQHHPIDYFSMSKTDGKEGDDDEEEVEGGEDVFNEDEENQRMHRQTEFSKIVI
jgi:hypothetical protein